MSVLYAPPSNACGPRLKTPRGFLLSTAILLLYLALAFSTGWLHGRTLFAISLLNGCLFVLYVGLVCSDIYRCADEFQRILLTRAFVSGASVTLAVASVWGHVEMSFPEAPRLHVIALPFILIGSGTLAKVLFFRKHNPVAAE